MSVMANGRMRRLWLNIHLWIGLGLAVLLVPISLSGALLVWHDEIEAGYQPSAANGSS
ncbi:MAG TPA: PepSY domain-containing protein [Xanthobacteraceae bacterium]|nr:PepSY domain-containing protein [Xanthobacteraceae bacterium]